MAILEAKARGIALLAEVLRYILIKRRKWREGGAGQE
jgi:hypothetical protein